jgi:hypothetical protein
MAIKILTQISTDKDITSEAYVRIVNYNINKTGIANFATQTYLNESDALENINMAFNSKIDHSFNVELTKEIDETVTVMQSVQKEVEVTQEVINPAYGEEGEEETITLTETVLQTVYEPVESIVKKRVPDLSILEGQDIFQFAYSKLKEKLSDLFGEENIQDC